MHRGKGLAGPRRRFGPPLRRLLASMVGLLTLAGCNLEGIPIPLPPDAGAIQVEANQCDPEPAGFAPRPTWGAQPDRILAFTTGDHDASSLGKVVSCDPNKLGQYPLPEGGNPHPKGADLQNLSTNFHILQSLTMTASVASKALSKLDKFSTEVNAPDGAKGTCVCSATAYNCLQTVNDQGRAGCDTFCDGSGILPTGIGTPCGGTLVWLPNDAYKTPTGATKFAAKQLHFLDDLKDFVNSPAFGAISTAMSSVSAALENIVELLSSLQCWIDLFTEGYHLGAYDAQRPDLHMCVGYYGHGAFAGFGEPGKFEIGGRYASHNLSASHRAQMRSGGFAVTAFGKTLSLLPNVELNTQLDDYGFFDRCKPAGFTIGGDPGWSCPDGWGIWVGAGAPLPGTVDIDKIDLFSMVDRTQLQTLDSDANGVVSGGEFVVAGYQPFRYPDHALGPYQWPRASVLAPWEAPVASVLSAGINLDLHITPIEKILGTYILYPGVTFIPILTLKAGIAWDHEAYKLRSRMLSALNKNLAPGLQFNLASFDREMHPMQAPDVTADTGSSVYVTPGVKAQLTVGLVLSQYLEVGISAFAGLAVDIRPAAHGGVADLSLALAEAVNASNPPEGSCRPVLSTSARKVCSDKSFDGLSPSHSDPKTTFACTPAKTANSCCLKFDVSGAASPAQSYAVCLDDWTGVPKEACACNQGVQTCYDQIKAYLPSGARAKMDGWLQNGELSSLVPTWNAAKTCQQCDEDGSCATPWWGRTPELTSLSDCAKHGSCVLPAGAAGPGSTEYDLTEAACGLKRGTFYRYQCVDEVDPVITGWQGPGCHPLTAGFPSACGCGTDSECGTGETCDGATGRCSSTPSDCACNPPGNADPAVPCGGDRLCVDGACVASCASGAACRPGFHCAGADGCVSDSAIPYAEQVRWRSLHPGVGPRHAIETYALTDLTLEVILSSGIRIGATVKLFGKKFEFQVWKWSDAWDVGSTQKARFQPGVEASYLDECHGSVGTVTNHQPGVSNPTACTGGNNRVCRYPSASSPNWSAFDQPDELIAQCKVDLPGQVEDPPAPTSADLGAAVGDTLDFGVEVGTTAWNENQICVGGELLTDWATHPPQLQGQCSYLGTTPGAPAHFPCTQLETFTLQSWGCLDTDTGPGAQVKAFLQANGLVPHTPDYLVAPTFPSASTSAEVIDLHALVVDSSVPSSAAQFDPAVWAAAASPWDQAMLRGFLASVEQCADAHFQSESVCQCTADADCNLEAGERCSQQQCLQRSGTLATCPFISVDAAIEPKPCCGDGRVDAKAGEQCDDGNLVSGDGCASNCKLEQGPAACCTPSGCIEMDGSGFGACAARKGNLFYGVTCGGLDGCGHPPQGGCQGRDGLCHQPITAEACQQQFEGRFLPRGCKPGQGGP